jgi:hypothetical protein
MAPAAPYAPPFGRDVAREDRCRDGGQDRARATQRCEASHEVLPSLLSPIEPAAVNVHAGRTRGRLACLKGHGGPGAHTPDSEPVKRH